MRKTGLILCMWVLCGVAEASAAAGAIFDIRADGAIGDGVTLNTRAMQTAIDQCTAAGGGTVLVAGGF